MLGVTPKDGARTRVFAFSGTTADNIPVGAPKAGYKWRLTEFEKSPYAHILSIKYDPYEGAFIAWYIGGFGLMGALVFVFFVSHRRMWARISAEENGNACEIVLAGEANRNHSAFEDRFNRIVDSLRGTKE
jgi:cytochrome c biogenesis protein ResB